MLGDILGSLAVNSASSLGSAFLGDWFSDQNAERDQQLDLQSYLAKSNLDYDFYSSKYAPLNQKLQKDMFDYTSAGNLSNSKDYYKYTYDYAYQKSLDQIADRKNALIAAGYNPILAVNGGLSALGVSGSTIGTSGQLGASGSPHSASGLSRSVDRPSVDLGRLSLGDLVALQSSAAQIAKTKAETDQITARTDAVRAEADLDKTKSMAEMSSLVKELNPGDDVGILDERGLMKLEEVFRNKLERDAYLNSVERQKILDAVGIGVDAASSAASLKHAFSPKRAR